MYAIRSYYVLVGMSAFVSMMTYFEMLTQKPRVEFVEVVQILDQNETKEMKCLISSKKLQ